VGWIGRGPKSSADFQSASAAECANHRSRLEVCATWQIRNTDDTEVGPILWPYFQQIAAFRLKLFLIALESKGPPKPLTAGPPVFLRRRSSRPHVTPKIWPLATSPVSIGFSSRCANDHTACGLITFSSHTARAPRHSGGIFRLRCGSGPLGPGRRRFRGRCGSAGFCFGRPICLCCAATARTPLASPA
jgi:hypothetical protein